MEENQKGLNEKIIYDQEIEMPAIPLRGISIFPQHIVALDIGRKRSVESLNKAMEQGEEIFLVSQTEELLELPKQDDLYEIGTICKIKQVMQSGDVSIRVLVEGIKRAKLVSFEANEAFSATIQEIKLDLSELTEEENIEYEAYSRNLIEGFKKYAAIESDIPKDSTISIFELTDNEVITDAIASSILFKFDQKQNVLTTLNLKERMEIVYKAVLEEIEIRKIESEINKRVKKQLNKIQKEYFLREQMKAIQRELGEDSTSDDDIDEYTDKLKKLKIKASLKEKITKELEKYKRTPINAPDSMIIKNYLDTIFSLPWNKESRNKFDINKAEEILNQDHCGLDDVKERILEYLAVRKKSKNMKAPIICLAGPPGVGKTSIAKSVARALERKYVRVSLGGVKDEAEIRGHRRTYIGAIPGRIINAMKDAKTKNPVFLLDEIDKMASDFRGDPTSAMLEVLDPEQNKEFVDHYLELPFDLSKVLFITTANSIGDIPRPLYDRMEVIEIEGYTDEEKIDIVKEHLLPKQIKENGLDEGFVQIPDDIITYIISRYTREAGVRTLERTIGKVCRKVVKELLSNEELTKVLLTKQLVVKYLGTEKFKEQPLSLKPHVGLTNGLAWTQVGGVTLEVEAIALKGKGDIVLTGKLGDVMKESAKTGITYIRSISKEMNIDPDFYKNEDIHIHLPEGATPKDGPSAGITMALAVISTLTNRPVAGDVAMTGELTLTGRVLPVGGVREKVLAAYRAGIRKIILPKDCVDQLDKLPEEIKSEIEFKPVEQMSEVIDFALLK